MLNLRIDYLNDLLKRYVFSSQLTTLQLTFIYSPFSSSIFLHHQNTHSNNQHKQTGSVLTIRSVLKKLTVRVNEEQNTNLTILNKEITATVETLIFDFSNTF